MTDLFHGVDLLADGHRALGPLPRIEDDSTTSINRRTRHEEWPRVKHALESGAIFTRHGKIDKWVAYASGRMTSDPIGMMDRTMVTILLKARILEACCPVGTKDRVRLSPQYIGAA